MTLNLVEGEALTHIMIKYNAKAVQKERVVQYKKNDNAHCSVMLRRQEVYLGSKAR